MLVNLDDITVGINEYNNKVITFDYLIGDHQTNVKIIYTKTFPNDAAFRSIIEWEVEISLSKDSSVHDGILSLHLSDIAIAVAEHESNLLKNHSIVVSHA